MDVARAVEGRARIVIGLAVVGKLTLGAVGDAGASCT